MTWSGGGAPQAVWSSVVWASLTRVASYPLANAPWSVERTHASVCAPTTTNRPTARPDSTVSRVVMVFAPLAGLLCPTHDRGPSLTFLVRSHHAGRTRRDEAPVGLPGLARRRISMGDR